MVECRLVECVDSVVAAGDRLEIRVGDQPMPSSSGVQVIGGAAEVEHARAENERLQQLMSHEQVVSAQAQPAKGIDDLLLVRVRRVAVAPQ